MRWIWLRNGDFTNAERALLAKAPEALVEYAHHPEELPSLLASDRFHAALASGVWSEEQYLAALWHLTQTRTRFVAWLGEPSVELSATLARAGMFAIFPPDADPATLADSLTTAFLDSSTEQAALEGGRDSTPDWRLALVGRSRAMFGVCNLIELVGQRRSTVLVTGETGTGKEMVARAIHLASPRADKAWVPVNCTALPDTLLEAELFGHTKGAFTGAAAARVGRFEEAHQGTLFLDEIGDMPLDLQAKLLRVLQEREIQRIGSSQSVPVDVRVVAATNADLASRVREGKFREDLYYRLNVVPITIPPLRERMSDVPLLAQTFVEKTCRYEGIARKRILQEAMHHLCTYHWPGNVRQLENVIEMAVVLSGDREVLLPADFRLPSTRKTADPGLSAGADGIPKLPEDGLDFEAAVSALERALLMQALDRSKGNKRAAAELLRLKRTTLTAKIKSLDLAS
ncbi:MAG: sigma-54 dependent transcriptional regulator [Bryobacterales bacterium]|nr:sigma-54 dependent transcriptional regulator [Bryobacterales bacterium]